MVRKEGESIEIWSWISDFRDVGTRRFVASCQSFGKACFWPTEKEFFLYIAKHPTYLKIVSSKNHNLSEWWLLDKYFRRVFYTVSSVRLLNSPECSGYIGRKFR